MWAWFRLRNLYRTEECIINFFSISTHFSTPPCGPSGCCVEIWEGKEGLARLWSSTGTLQREGVPKCWVLAHPFLWIHTDFVNLFTWGPSCSPNSGVRMQSRLGHLQQPHPPPFPPALPLWSLPARDASTWKEALQSRVFTSMIQERLFFMCPRGSRETDDRSTVYTASALCLSCFKGIYRLPSSLRLPQVGVLCKSLRPYTPANQENQEAAGPAAFCHWTNIPQEWVVSLPCLGKCRCRLGVAPGSYSHSL